MDDLRQDRMWMDAVAEATVEVSSEDELFPITAALGHALTNGWRAATTGPQVVRLLFREPRRLEHVRLHVVDRVAERTQEMRLRAGRSVDSLTDVARWTFSFSPRGSTDEVEECTLGLDEVSVLELRIDPDMRRSAENEQVYAVLKSFWLA